MRDTCPQNNSGQFPNRNFSMANCLNVVTLDEPSEPDGDAEAGFDGSQYNSDDDPAYGGTRLLVSVQFDFMSWMELGISKHSKRRTVTK
jgi:hypothetical protein